MVFMDSILEFWDGQALTVQEESRTNGNILDLETDGATLAQLGFLYWNLVIGTAAGGLDSGGYFQLVTSTSLTFVGGLGVEEVLAAFGSNENPLAVADLAKNARFSVAIPLRPAKKFVEIEFIPINQAASGLVVNSWLGMEPVSPLNIQKEPT